MSLGQPGLHSETLDQTDKQKIGFFIEVLYSPAPIPHS